MKRNKADRSGLTVVEVMMVVVILAVIVATVFLPALAKAKPNRHRPSCVNNLKQIGLAFRIYANDNSDVYPMRVPEAEGGALESTAAGNIVQIFQVMSNVLSVPRVVTCPTERRPFGTNWASLSNSNISYFVGLDAEDGRTNMILSGDRDMAENGQLLNGALNLTTNRPVVWRKLLHKEGGNVALSDGSVQQTTTTTLRQLLANTGDATNRVLFPQ